MPIYAVRTTVGQERNVADLVALRVEKAGHKSIRAILVPEEVKGYVFIESDDYITVLRATYGVQHVKGVIRKPMTIEEVEHLLIVRSPLENIKVGDIVELISGPFKGERARVVRINESKEEVVVELLEAAVPIPVTVRADYVKLIKEEGA